MPPSTFTIDSLPDLTGKVYLVTGGNTGIGKATVAGLVSKGATVYMGARSESKANEAIREIQASIPAAKLYFLKLDLSDLRGVNAAARSLCAQETVLHGLVNNAGVMGVPYTVTGDGYEVQFQTNYLSHWLLTYRLLPLLSAAGAASKTVARVVNVTSDGHARFPPKNGIHFDDLNLAAESAMTRYGQSKLANILHARELNHRYGPASGTEATICVTSVHPGHIDTELNRQATGSAPAFVLRIATPIMRCLGILDEQAKGAWSSLFAIASQDLKMEESGAYIVPYAKIGRPSNFAQDDTLGRKLWEWTEKELSQKGLLK